MKDKYILIHIGKCGGSTVRDVLHKLRYKTKNVHFHQPKFNINRKYIITLRNPIARFISAFNWRYHNVVVNKTPGNILKTEKVFFAKYKTVNELAEAIFTDKGELNINLSSPYNYVKHIHETIDFYLGNFLDICDKTNIYGITLTETLNDDLKRLFGVTEEILTHKLKNAEYSKYLSDLGRNNLKKWLYRDYQCIEKLFKMELITQEQYDILSK